jgi:hypothetical protein
MRAYPDRKSLGARLTEIFEKDRIVLFAGAGVSARAGLPVWHTYLRHLAKVAEHYEPLVAKLIQKRIENNLLLQAADAYMGCVEIPAGERLKQLAEPFAAKNYIAGKLLPLVTLPFDFIVATNYDRAIHDACTAAQKVAKSAELNDLTLAHAAYWEDFFVARVHGRAEVPSSIVLDSGSYKALDDNSEYADFLHRTFTRRSCLFVGFSFLDPAIDKILNFIAEEGVYPKIHYALVPQSKDPLAERMSTYNIEVLLYDDTAGHDLIWNVFEDMASGRGIAEPLRRPRTFETAKRLLAVCYAGAKMESHGVALRHLVVQGIVLSALDRGTTSVRDLTQDLRKYLPVDAGRSEILVADALTALAEKKLCLREGDTVVLVEDLSKKISTSPVELLVKGVINRLFVRNALEVKAEVQAALAHIAEETIMLRGFDLGAEFAGAQSWTALDPTPTIEEAIQRHLPQYWQDRKHLIAAAFVDLLRRPEPPEELALSELGRLSFGIEVVLRAGRSTMYALSLPEIVYLDANVLMPAMVAGHPYRNLYIDAIRKIQRASRKGNPATRVVVADVFLEEVIKHRQIAIDVVHELGLENLERIRKPITYYGSEDVNVFIGAYSTWLSANSNKEDTSFTAFLAETASYSNQKELEAYLERNAIDVVSTEASSQKEVASYADAVDRLLTAYQVLEVEDEKSRGKALVLKKHEARQMAILERDIDRGFRSIFVTADHRLKRAVGKGDFRKVDHLLLSHRNLVQLVDLLIGLEMDPSSLTRLLWTVQIADDRAALKEYLINRALQHYDAAMLLKMNDLLDAYVDKTIRDAKLENVDLLSKGTKGRIKTTKFLDRVEEHLFTELAEEVRKLREELRSYRN